MPKPSTGPTIAERLKAKTEAELAEIEPLIHAELTRLSQNLNANAGAALSITERVITEGAEALSQHSGEQLRKSGQAIEQQLKVLQQGTLEELTRAGEGMQRQMASAGQKWGRQALQPLKSALDQTTRNAETAQQSAEQLSAALREIEGITQRTKRALMTATLIPLLVGLSLLASIFAGSWGMTRYQLGVIQAQQQEIDRLRKLLEQLPQGVTYYSPEQTQDGRPLLVFPPGTRMTATCGNQPCIQL